MRLTDKCWYVFMEIWICRRGGITIKTYCRRGRGGVKAKRMEAWAGCFAEINKYMY